MKKWEVRMLPWSFDVIAGNEAEAEERALTHLRLNEGELSDHLVIEEDDDE